MTGTTQFGATVWAGEDGTRFALFDFDINIDGITTTVENNFCNYGMTYITACQGCSGDRVRITCDPSSLRLFD